MKISASAILPKKKDFAEIRLNENISESRFLADAKDNIALEVNPATRGVFNRRKFVILTRQMVYFAKRYGIKKLALDWRIIESLKMEIEVKEMAEILSLNFEMANYEFVKFKTPPKEGWKFVEEIIIVSDKNKIKDIKNGLEKGQLIGREINASRDLANTPGGDMTPDLMAKEIRKALGGTGIRMKLLDEKEMKKLGMGAILGVARGSFEKPRFIILEYKGGKGRPIVFVGKAITFDTGGLNLRPSDGITDMHLDMSGGAAVAYALIAAAKLKIKKNMVALIPCAENMPFGESLRPGDILRSMSGKTIEILNTDAEGRVILADALTFAEKYDPDLVVDVATLTGAAVVTFGERASAILSKDDDLIKLFQDLGEKSGDYVWPLPLWDEYESDIKGNMGDWANIKSQGGNSRSGGSITAAMFLYQFAKKFRKWIHIDMAPREAAVYDEFLAKGSSGSPIRLLIKLLETYK